MKKLTVLIALFILTSFQILAAEDFAGRYCEIEDAYTDSGTPVYGEFYMYSDAYGEADNVYTEDDEAVYGECYRYGNYCELEGAYTENGENVNGLCYIYQIV